MGADPRRGPSISLATAAALIAAGLLALAPACGGGTDGSTSDVDADADVDAGGDGGDDGGADGGGDGGSDTDADTDTGDAGVTPCDPQVCDDGCFAGGKKLGECIDGLCECSGERNFGCDCRAAGGARSSSLGALLLTLVGG